MTLPRVEDRIDRAFSSAQENGFVSGARPSPFLVLHGLIAVDVDPLAIISPIGVTASRTRWSPVPRRRLPSGWLNRGRRAADQVDKETAPAGADAGAVIPMRWAGLHSASLNALTFRGFRSFSAFAACTRSI
jgi:hypothetical protein